MTDLVDIPDVHLDEPLYRPAPAYEPPGEPMGRRAPTRFKRVNTNAIMAATFEPIRWIIPGYVPEGFSVLAGRQKLGKTWLAIDWALAVAWGGFAMGSVDVEGGDVLYIDCENGERRIQRRIAALYPDERDRPDLSRLEWATGAPALDKGFLDALDDWRLSVANPRLVVIDVLQRIKPPGMAARNAYENDYSIWAPLQEWATKHGVAVVGLHHTKKGGADDPLEALSGSNGLSACADTTLVLDRSGEGITLYVRGRDVDEKETALDFDAGRWSIKGEASEVRKSAERHLILKALSEADAPMNPTEIGFAAEMKRNNVEKLLAKLCKAGDVVKAARGRYVHKDRPELLTDQQNQTGGQIGQKVRSPAMPQTGNVIYLGDQGFKKASHTLQDCDIAEVSDHLTDLTGGLQSQNGAQTAKSDPSPMLGDATMRAFEARASATTCATGEGKARRLTSEGEQLLDEMLRAGVSPRIAAHMVGTSRQNAERRLLKIKADGNG